MRSLSIHELAHIKRRDPAIRILELIVGTVFWFNPALWVIRHQLRRAEELACDAVVADSLKSTSEIYAGAFLKTIDFLAADGIVRPPAMICTVGGYRFCTQRLKAMVNASNHVGVSRLQAIVTAAVALPILLAGFVTASDPGTSTLSTNEAAVVRTTSFPAVGASNVLGTDELTSLDQEILKELSAVKETPKITFHYRPGDLDDQSLAKVVKANVEKFEECESLLRMKYKGRVHIFLYRDVADLQRTTGTGAVAFPQAQSVCIKPLNSIAFMSLRIFLRYSFPTTKIKSLTILLSKDWPLSWRSMTKTFQSILGQPFISQRLDFRIWLSYAGHGLAAHPQGYTSTTWQVLLSVT